jgi:hypothetical protein
VAKAPPDPRHVVLRAVKRGEVIERPARTGEGYVKEKIHDEGLYFLPTGATHGFFVEAPKLWEELDKLLD